MNATSRAIAITAWLLGSAGSAWAQLVADPPDATSSVDDAASHLLGDLGGLRSAMAEYGITMGLTEQSEVLGNVTGGTQRTGVYEGVTLMGLGLDTAKAFNIPGGTFNISALEFHGRGLSGNAVPTLTPVSSVEQSVRGPKLFELWYEQVLPGGKLALRVGQLSADTEFITTQYGGLFINSGYGFPTLPGADLPGGGPAYPLATPGARLRYSPSDTVTLLGGVFNGNPAGHGVGDPQARDASGTAFAIHDGTFAIAEMQYAANQADNAAGLPGTYKIGVWYNSLAFADQLFSYTGQSLADPSNMAAALRHRNDYSGYAVVDQMVWKRPGTKDGGIGVFARVMGAPPDRNLVDVFVQGGVTYKAPFAARVNDTVGFAVSWAHISPDATKLSADLVAFTGQAGPIRRSETQLELTYQAQVTAWLQVQPDFQYVINPGGGVPNPDTGKRVGDAAVLGVRTVITF
jgi:porin